MDSKNKIIEKLKKEEIKKNFLKRNIKHLYLIGSYAEGNNSGDSDIDLLYQTSNDTDLTLFDIIKLKNFLETKLKKNIDIADIDYINEFYKKNILNNKILIF